MNKIIDIKQERTDIANTLCRFAWDYSVLNISRNELRNCCRTRSHKILDEDWRLERGLFVHFPPIVDIRKDMLRGIRNEACGTCWDIEATGAQSPRTSFESFLAFLETKNVWPNLTREQLEYKLRNLDEWEFDNLARLSQTNMIEISLGNTCDLKCVYCHHHYSSQWAAENIRWKEIRESELERELPKIQDTTYETLWWDWFENESAYTTYCINFIGGEPLIIDKFYTYVDRILNFYNTHDVYQKNIDFSVVSNFNTPKKFFSKFLDLTLKIVDCQRFTFDFNVSCESIGSRAEYIRTNTDWSLMKSNIEEYIEFLQMIDPLQNRVIFNFQIALNSLCVSGFPDFIQWIIDLQNKTGRKIHLRQNIVSHPHWCSPFILPQDYSVYLDQSIELLQNEIHCARVLSDDYSLFGRWDHYISFLNETRKGMLNLEKNGFARKSFADNIEKMKIRRSLDFHATFPEMIPFLEECQRL